MAARLGISVLPLAWHLASLPLGACSDGKAPEQVHLALGSLQTSVNVAWVTFADAPAQVAWGTSKDALTASASGDSRPFTSDPDRVWYSHAATLSDLKPSTRYYYKVGFNESWSDIFSFMHRREGAPYRHVLFGDLGSAAAFSLCDACTASDVVCDAKSCANKKTGLVSEVDKADIMVHLGDFGYDLDSDGGKVGDQFMRNVEQLAANMPYMVMPGNHENSKVALAHYQERFRTQPTNAVPETFTTVNGETPNVNYFSWNYGLVHYVTISTELWFGITDGKTTKETQLEWLEKDLAAASTPEARAETPWLIVLGHRSIYCSCDQDCDADAWIVRRDVEPLLFKYGVDLFINAHEHNYERTFPIYKSKFSTSTHNPTAPMFIVTGCAGNHEMHEPFVKPQPGWSAYRSNSFGYSVMTVHNATHLHWQQVQTDPTEFPLSEYGRIIDDAWVVQERHGPFEEAQAPSDDGFSLSSYENQAYDHWTPFLSEQLLQESSLPDTCQAVTLNASSTALPNCLQDMADREGEHWWDGLLSNLKTRGVGRRLQGKFHWRGKTRPESRSSQDAADVMQYV
eukprot:TRINITY_DN10353_c0_g1_i1.p1 TRINITY_DN10353_c0_g1~~TRINITY_DN10353_c0_g1_i1.p1  ORF type:complete len:589 (-),score=88.12 TRINITY_DN10353_c0_g1_i1:439-2148(-)